MPKAVRAEFSLPQALLASFDTNDRTPKNTRWRTDGLKDCSVSIMQSQVSLRVNTMSI